MSKIVRHWVTIWALVNFIKKIKIRQFIINSTNLHIHESIY